MNTQQKLNKLRALALKLMLTQKEIEDLVAVLRSPDMDGYCEASWSEVGEALGITKQGAQQHYSMLLKGVRTR